MALLQTPTDRWWRRVTLRSTCNKTASYRNSKTPASSSLVIILHQRLSSLRTLHLIRLIRVNKSIDSSIRQFNFRTSVHYNVIINVHSYIVIHSYTVMCTVSTLYCLQCSGQLLSLWVVHCAHCICQVLAYFPESQRAAQCNGILISILVFP